MTRMVALLRAVNVGGRKLPMADLRKTCVELGWKEVSTYIQSGNVVFSASEKPERLEEALEKAIEEVTGLKVPVIIRTAAQWAAYPKQLPFVEVAKESPNRLMLLLSKKKPADAAEAAIQMRAQAGEQVLRVGDAVWIHYSDGVGTSKLTPNLIDRSIGSPATGRNFRTVLKLEEMLSQ